MKTDDLIRALAQDEPTPRASVGHGLALAIALGLILATGVFHWTLGVRGDIAYAMYTPRFLLKFVVTLSLAASAIALVLRLVRPGAQSRALAFALWIGPAILAVAIVYELFAIPSSAWRAQLVGWNSRTCLLSIPLFSAPLLIAILAALRRGAPTRPVLAGLIAGLAAGGLGATLYAAHCGDDSPLFVMAWYMPAILLMAGIGAFLGARVLRW